jgi:hypothetical protein
MSANELPDGWDKHHVQRMIRHHDDQSEDEATIEEDEVIEFDLTSLPPITPEALSHVHVHIRGGGPVEPKFVIEEVTEPGEAARLLDQDKRARRNEIWLQSHWSELLPGARGRFIAVAGQEAFIADNQEEARAKARAAHPADDGIIEQYIRPERGPRLYAHQGCMVDFSRRGEPSDCTSLDR